MQALFDADTYFEAVPMGFETSQEVLIFLATIDFEAVPMGFETRLVI